MTIKIQVCTTQYNNLSLSTESVFLFAFASRTVAAVTTSMVPSRNVNWIKRTRKSEPSVQMEPFVSRVGR
jgi:hypothetical protein